MYASLQLPAAEMERLMRARHPDPGALLRPAAVATIAAVPRRTLQPRAEQVLLRSDAEPGIIRELQKFIPTAYSRR